MGGRLTFILGGARSGKSRYAEARATALGGPVLFVATAETLDAEMAARIEAHRVRRPAGWQTLEVPRGVGKAIREHGARADVVLLECLTLLANNVLAQEGEEPVPTSASIALQDEIEDILRACRLSGAHWFVVSNEVGLGLVPANPLGRVYRDILGQANQTVAREADEVVFMVAGLPLTLKGTAAGSPEEST